MDELDIEIIKNLQENARKSLRTIGDSLNKPHTTIHSRLKKIESDGIIKDYTAILNPHKIGLKIGYLIIDVPEDKSDEVSSSLASMPETMHVMRTNEGKVIVKLLVESNPKTKNIDSFIDKLCDHSSEICDYPMQSFYVNEIVKYEQAIDELVLDKKKK